MTTVENAFSLPSLQLRRRDGMRCDAMKEGLKRSTQKCFIFLNFRWFSFPWQPRQGKHRELLRFIIEFSSSFLLIAWDFARASPNRLLSLLLIKLFLWIFYLYPFVSVLPLISWPHSDIPQSFDEILKRTRRYEAKAGIVVMGFVAEFR